MKHLISITVKNYPGSSYAHRIVWDCTCGKHDVLTDGRTLPTVKRARNAAKRHYTKAA